MGWLTVSIIYIILVSLLIFLFLAPKVKLFIKVIAIPIIIWFSIITYYSAQSFKGYPIYGDPPLGSIIVGSHIVETVEVGKEPEIYLMVLHPRGYKIGEIVNPTNPFQFIYYFKEGEPVLYKINYSDELRKKLKEAMKEKNKKGGVIIWGFTGKKGEGNELQMQTGGVAVLNEFEILKKEGAE